MLCQKGIPPREDTKKTVVTNYPTHIEDRFAYPSTVTIAGNDTWIMNANFSELAEGNNVPSKKFSIQLAVFRPVK